MTLSKTSSKEVSSCTTTGLGQNGAATGILVCFWSIHRECTDSAACLLSEAR